uniref:C-type lectin domain-containing protein n=1 Tax=Oryzias latipes TaxID=8090 RepID=H2LXN7_ORYLA
MKEISSILTQNFTYRLWIGLYDAVDSWKWSDPQNGVKVGDYRPCYELQLETRSWLDAQSFCRLNHADLANVTSPAEGEKVKALLQRDGVEQAWFGLHRDSWVWTDGSATSYTSWLAGQPNNAGRSQGCVYMEKEKWNDFPCTNQYYVLCQSKATFTLPSEGASWRTDRVRAGSSG